MPTVTPARFVTPAPFNPTATPVPAGQPVATDDAIRVENAALQVQPPGQCSLVENVAEPGRFGSVRAFDYKLQHGFGCPSPDPNVRLEEMQILTAASVGAYETECASGGCDDIRLTAGDFDTQRQAWQSGQNAGGWLVVNVSGRNVLARSVPQEGAPIVMRHYAEYCGDVRVENRLVLLGDNAEALATSADGFFATIGLNCQAGG